MPPNEAEEKLRASININMASLTGLKILKTHSPAWGF